MIKAEWTNKDSLDLQQTCNKLATTEEDLISREDAVNTIKRYKHRLEGRGQTYGFLLEEFEHQIPSAEAEWIPCSERLPSEDGEYLVQMSWWGSQMNVYMWADGWNCHRINGKVSRLSEIDGEDIVAWMPLPKPYREDGEA